MGWHGSLSLRYSRDVDRTVALDRHEGPLRVLRRLYPEGPRICHHVLVHPPGGIVGGDVLSVDAHLDEGYHALITTAGATRFYRSAGATAVQHVRTRVAPGARLEWLPLETLAYGGLNFRHDPLKKAGAGEVAGHLHPAALLVRRERGIRRPCFATDGKRMIMPSFGVMTGGLDLRHKAFAGLFEKTELVAHMLGQGRVHSISYGRLSG